ncbi:MAG: hypothetical protein ACK4WF_07740, partial [Candidatus Brocadiales bacterium]
TIDTAVHLAIGMWAAFLTCCCLLPFRTFRKRFIPYCPIFIIVCGCWSLVPDFPVAFWPIPGNGEWLLWVKGLKQPLHTPVLGNVFFMHAYIDEVLDRTKVHSSFELMGIISMVFMFSVMAGFFVIFYLRERLTNATTGKRYVSD